MHEFIKRVAASESNKYDFTKSKNFRFLPNDFLTFDVIKSDLNSKIKSTGVDTKVTEIDVLRACMKAYIEKNNL